MTDMQTSLLLLIVRPSILNPVINFSTHLWSVKWSALQIYLCLAHSIPSPPSLMQHMHQPYHKRYDPLHIIMWPCWFIDLDLTCCSPLSSSISAKSCSSFTAMRFIAPKPQTCPFTLATGPSSQVLSWSSPPYSHDSMSCLICNELHHYIFTYGLISYVFSRNQILVHLGCHSITKTKQGPFNLFLFGNWWQLYKDIKIKLKWIHVSCPSNFNMYKWFWTSTTN